MDKNIPHKRNTQPEHSVPGYKKTAFFLSVILFVLSAGCLLWIFFAGRRSREHLFPGAPAGENSSQRIVADIYQDGTLLQSIPLDTVEEPYTFTITTEDGGWNEVEIRPGSIGILSASCPDGLCVHQGFISTSLLPITCLPNRLVIQIRLEETGGQGSATADETLDAITY